MGQRDKVDWSWKPDIHSHQPIPGFDIGDARYKYDPLKPGRKVHEINPETGKSWCQVENGSNRVTACDVQIPAGRLLCQVCQQKKTEKCAPKKRPKDFYKSHEWAQVRYTAFLEYGRQCVVCGTSKNLTVDHIKPLRTHPELATDLSNLQVMCRLCNRGKAGWDDTDWRER